MIHILTHNPAVRQQLSQLLNEMDREHCFHDDIEPVIKAVRKLGKQDHVFYDLQLEDILWAFERLHTACKRTHLVTFEPQTNETSLDHNQCPAGVDHYLLLPSNAERAQSRLQEIFRSIAHSQTARPKRKAPRKRAATAPGTAKAQASEPPADTAGDCRDPFPANPMIARYLQARSRVMRDLLAEIETVVDSAPVIVLEGDEGAEFELLAREINFRANGDATPLHLINPMQIEREEIDEVLRIHAGESDPQFVYLGMTADWTTKAAIEFEDLVEQLSERKGPVPRVICAHASGSEDYCAESVLRLFKVLRRKGKVLELPGMTERADDIPTIARTAFSTLRMAHPFLRTRVLSEEAVRYLKSEREDMDYSRLTRIIRNAMALCKQTTITEETIRNLSDDSPMTQHLIESLADERYFKTGGE
ncbi:MAG: hypothetical protein ACLFVC_08655 [Opitutales bacterium]